MSNTQTVVILKIWILLQYYLLVVDKLWEDYRLLLY